MIFFSLFKVQFHTKISSLEVNIHVPILLLLFKSQKYSNEKRTSLLLYLNKKKLIVGNCGNCDECEYRN